MKDLRERTESSERLQMMMQPERIIDSWKEKVKIPGFIDLQVNGYKGVDFSSLDLTEDSFCFACEQLLEAGTAAFLPTLITGPKEVYIKNLPLIAEAMKKDCFNNKILGIHLEGPFISDQPGAVGAHPKEYTRDPSTDLFDELWDLSKGRIKLLTLAAELRGAAQLAEYATTKNVAVSLGHQMADYQSMKKLYDAGARSITHFGNGMPNQIPRHQNPIVSALAIKGLKAMIITDGHHLLEQVIRTVFNAKDIGDIIVTSDASPIAGLGSGKYNVLGNDIILEENGLLHNPQKQCLVGSSSVMLECMNYLASLGIVSVKELLNVGFYNPLKLIGVDPSKIEGQRSVVWNEHVNKFEIINN